MLHNGINCLDNGPTITHIDFVELDRKARQLMQFRCRLVAKFLVRVEDNKSSSTGFCASTYDRISKTTSTTNDLVSDMSQERKSEVASLL